MNMLQINIQLFWVSAFLILWRMGVFSHRQVRMNKGLTVHCKNNARNEEYRYRELIILLHILRVPDSNFCPDAGYLVMITMFIFYCKIKC